MFISDAPTCLSGCSTLPLWHITMPRRVGASMPLFEEQFHLPATAIQIGDAAGGQGELVGQENEPLERLGIAVLDATQRYGKALVGIKATQDHGLIADHTACAIHGMRVAAF